MKTCPLCRKKRTFFNPFCVCHSCGQIFCRSCQRENIHPDKCPRCGAWRSYEKRKKEGEKFL